MNSDWDYLTKARNGDEKACVYIFNKYSKSLIRMTLLITGSLDAAKDIVQETFYRLINNRIKHQQGSFKTYLTTIAYRLALKEKYREKKNQLIEEDDLMEDPSSFLEQQISKETQKNIFQAIRCLSSDHRDVLILRFYGEHSYEEIAEIIKIPLGTVKSRIYYAVKACGEKLKEKGVLE